MRDLLHGFEELISAYAGHSDNAGERAGRQRLGTMHWNRYSSRVAVLYHHVMAAFNSIKPKAKLLQGPNGLLATGGGNARHSGDSNQSLQCLQFTRG